MNCVITLGSVGEISAVTNKIINIYTPFVEEMKEVAEEKIRNTFFTKTGREKGNPGIWDVESLFGVTLPTVVVEATYKDEKVVYDITRKCFGHITKSNFRYFTAQMIERHITKEVKYNLESLIEAPVAKYSFKVEQQERENFTTWFNDFLEKADNERYKTALKELVTMFHNGGPLVELGEEKTEEESMKIWEIRNEIKALNNIH